MDKSQRDQLVTELVISLATTVLFVVIYWLTMLPEWQRQMYLSAVKGWLKKKVSDGLTLAQRMELEKFRGEIMAWEREMRRNAGT
jgi:hypothetical protein